MSPWRAPFYCFGEQISEESGEELLPSKEHGNYNHVLSN